jgi:hypothetical protein
MALDVSPKVGCPSCTCWRLTTRREASLIGGFPNLSCGALVLLWQCRQERELRGRDISWPHLLIGGRRHGLGSDSKPRRSSPFSLSRFLTGRCDAHHNLTSFSACRVDAAPPIFLMAQGATVPQTRPASPPPTPSPPRQSPAQDRASAPQWFPFGVPSQAAPTH